MGGGNNTPVLEAVKICKEFPGVKALQNVSLKVYPGEILGLVGENGAGKSTLMKVFTGAYSKDSGEIYVEGKKADIKTTSDARRLGISIVYQELSILPLLTVTENMFLGNLMTDQKGMVDWKAMEKRTAEALKNMGLDIAPNTVMRDLSIAQCQMVEICRATQINEAKVLIMDEPTSSLVNREIEYMFDIIMQLKQKGIAIIYISHKLEELFRITDRMEVLKDGENSASLVTKDITRDDVVRAMVGRELQNYYPPKNGVRGKEMLRVENLSQGKMVKNVSFTAYAGEILGFAGLIGAGRSETMMSVYGAMNDVTGKVFVEGKEINLRNAGDAINAGIAYGPEDRKNQGLVQIFSINTNISLANIKGIFDKFKLLDLRKERQVSKKYIEQINIKTPDENKIVGELSGGNQQKVIVGKLLFTDAKIYIFDEPTKGIDVGAKAEIYKLMREIANNGAAVIMVSSELPEVIGVSDRVIVMHDGVIEGEFEGNDIKEETLMQAAIGGNSNE